MSRNEPPPTRAWSIAARSGCLQTVQFLGTLLLPAIQVAIPEDFVADMSGNSPHEEGRDAVSKPRPPLLEAAYQLELVGKRAHPLCLWNAQAPVLHGVKVCAKPR